MKVFVASTLGFCGGVKRAVSLSYGSLEKAQREGRRLFFYGQLVHNSKVCRPFDEYGAAVITKAEEAEENSIVIIRAHGIRDSERRILESRSVTIVDATCPVVAKSQDLIRSSVLPVLIFGYPGHSEVVSLEGSSTVPVRVISSEKDFETIEKVEYNCIIQTTFSATLAEELLLKAKEKGITLNVLNGICPASEERRSAVRALYRSVDGFVVVGDGNSANTKELLRIAQESGKKCFFVSGAEDIPDEVYSLERIGLTAGASTPEDVYLKVKEELEE